MIRAHATSSTTWLDYDPGHHTFTIEGPHRLTKREVSPREALCCLEHPQMFDCSLDAYRRLVTLGPFGRG